MKKIIACIISFILFTVCIPFTATAKVIEPEVVKTEKWTTSYYIDDDMDTLYPYIQCEADIYNDGTIELYMWNTHEWDGFANVSHNIAFEWAKPISTSALEYELIASGVYRDVSGYVYYPISEVYYRGGGRHLGSLSGTKPYTYNPPVTSEYSDIKISYYPAQYRITEHDIMKPYWDDGLYGEASDGFNDNKKYVYYKYGYEKETIQLGDSYNWQDNRKEVDFNQSKVILAKLPTSREEACEHYTLTPKNVPVEIYNFRLFGHDITITPELLSGNIVAEPVLTEQEQYIKQLEEENKKLKEQLNNPYTGYITIEQNNGTAAERFPVTVYSDGRTETTEEFQNYINSLNVKIEQLMNRINLVSNGSCGDIDGDGNISVEDAQLLLQYYTESKVAQLTNDPIDVWYFVKFGKG